MVPDAKELVPLGAKLLAGRLGRGLPQSWSVGSLDVLNGTMWSTVSVKLDERFSIVAT